MARLKGEVVPLSIIVPAFQPGAHLVETLASIERQTVVPSEVVVVDDGSDPPIERPSLGPSVRLLKINHSGIAGARNAGIRATTAPLVHICDHDDVLEPTFVEQMSAAFRTQTSVDVVHGVCGFIDQSGALLPGRLPYRQPPAGRTRAILTALLSENYIGSVAAVFRREAFTRIGGFRPLDYVQDWDFWLRLVSTGSQFCHVPEVVAWHRVHPEQQSREAHRVSILEESLDMVSDLCLPIGLWPARRRALAKHHLHASRVLRSRGEPGALHHLVSAWSRRPFKTTGAVLRSLHGA